MKKIVLISCASQKGPTRTRAAELYTSPLFKLNLAYARKLKPAAIFILSAKYGLLGLEDEIEPYDVTLNNMTAGERKLWTGNVADQLRQHSDLSRDHFIILAGQRYRQYLVPHLVSYEIPLQGLTIGKQLQHLKRVTANE